MIIISLLAAFTALLLLYIILRGSLNVFKEKKRSNLLDKIEKIEQDIIVYHEKINNLKSKLKTIDFKEEITIKNIKLMKDNNLIYIENKKIYMKEKSNQEIEIKKQNIENQIIEKVFMSLLETLNNNDNSQDINKLLEKIKSLLLQRK